MWQGFIYTLSILSSFFYATLSAFREQDHAYDKGFRNAMIAIESMFLVDFLAQFFVTFYDSNSEKVVKDVFTIA